MTPKTYAHFDFVIEDIPEADARALMASFVRSIDRMGYFTGGGVRMETDADYPEEANDEQVEPE